MRLISRKGHTTIRGGTDRVVPNQVRLGPGSESDSFFPRQGPTQSDRVRVRGPTHGCWSRGFAQGPSPTRSEQKLEGSRPGPSGSERKLEDLRPGPSRSERLQLITTATLVRTCWVRLGPTATLVRTCRVRLGPSAWLLRMLQRQRVRLGPRVRVGPWEQCRDIEGPSPTGSECDTEKHEKRSGTTRSTPPPE